MQKQKKEKKRVKKKNGGELAYQEEFFFEGRGGALALARARSYLERPGIHLGSPGLSYVSIYTPDGRKYVVSWGCFPGGLCSVFSGPISPVCRLGPGAIFFPVFFVDFSDFSDFSMFT